MRNIRSNKPKFIVSVTFRDRGSKAYDASLHTNTTRPEGVVFWCLGAGRFGVEAEIQRNQSNTNSNTVILSCYVREPQGRDQVTDL